MQLKLSDRIMKPDFQGEFTASILAAAASPDIISFAGGRAGRHCVSGLPSAMRPWASAM